MPFGCSGGLNTYPQTMLKFSANLSLLFNEVPLLERIRLAREHQFNGVEIQFPYSVPARELHAELKKTALPLVLFNVWADDLLQGGEGLACVPNKQAAFKKAVALAYDYAEILHPECINILPGRCINTALHAEYWHTFLHNLDYAAQQFAPLGIKTVFEGLNTLDMPGALIHRGEQMLTVFNTVNNPHIFLQYDCYHAQKMHEDPCAFIRCHAHKIGHIQIADCPGRGQPGTGSLDFRALFAAIEQSTYTGWIGAEYNPVGSTHESLAWYRYWRSIGSPKMTYEQSSIDT